mmetsp:Transcript_37190/g.76223  ORF Transcript_37190/g.76223 Transcript_37190/m.76223 type:complete len:107 (-) Transcript_37190:236-556(-)
MCLVLLKMDPDVCNERSSSHLPGRSLRAVALEFHGGFFAYWCKMQKENTVHDQAFNDLRYPEAGTCLGCDSELVLETSFYTTVPNLQGSSAKGGWMRQHTMLAVQP